MWRRGLIKTTGLVLLTGCTESTERNGTTPTPTRRPTSTSFPDSEPPVVVPSPSDPPTNDRGQVSNNEAISSLQDVARDNGMNIFYQEFGDSGWAYFEYSSGDEADETLREDMAVLVNEYVGLTKRGWNTYLLEAALKDPAKDYPNALIASWYCRREWVEAVIDGGVTKDELVTRVSTTTVEH